MVSLDWDSVQGIALTDDYWLHSCPQCCRAPYQQAVKGRVVVCGYLGNEFAISLGVWYVYRCPRCRINWTWGDDASKGGIKW